MENIFRVENGQKIINILIIGGFLSMLNETALNIAFPTIMLEYAISASTVQWLTTVYVLVSGIVFLMSAYLIKKFSTRKLFISSMFLLVVGSIISMVSVDFQMLIFGRIVQAIGTGIIVPLVFNSVLYLTLPQKRGLMMGIVSLVVLSAPIFAPVIMGLVMEFTNWHFYFVLMTILFAISIIFSYKQLENITETKDAKLDVLSIIYATIGFTLILYGFSNLGEISTNSLIIAFVIGLVALLLFIHRQLTIDHPLLGLRVFRDKQFVIGILTNLSNIMVLFGVVILIPMYLETALHTSSLVASLIMLPGTVLGSIIPIISGHIYDEHGPRIVICSGMAFMAIATFLFANLSLTTTFLEVGLITCIFYLGSGLALSPNQTNTLGNLKPEDYPSGTAIMNSLQQIGGAIGSSLFVSFMTLGENRYLSGIANPTAQQKIIGLVTGVNHSFLIGTILLVIIFVLTLFIKQKAEYKNS